MKRPPFRKTVRVPLEKFHSRLGGDMARLAKGGAFLATAARDEIHRRVQANAPVVSGFYRASQGTADLRGVQFVGARAAYSRRLEPGPGNRPSRQAPRGVFDPERERAARTIEAIAIRFLLGIGSAAS